MLRESRGCRRYREQITLTATSAEVDEFGHAAMGESHIVGVVMAEVKQMSATKTMMTYQQADIIGVDLEFRRPECSWDGIVWRGHEIYAPQAEDVDMRGRIVKVSGWYKIDDPDYVG